MAKLVLSCTLSISFLIIIAIQENSSIPTLFNEDVAKQISAEKRVYRPQWDDLGWAWGKRADHLRPHWEDLGWSWGKRSAVNFNEKNSENKAKLEQARMDMEMSNLL